VVEPVVLAHGLISHASNVEHKTLVPGARDQLLRMMMSRKMDRFWLPEVAWKVAV